MSDEDRHTPAVHTTTETAALLGIDESRVKRMAAARGLGRKFGERVWMFSDADVEAMRVRKRGRPVGYSPKAQE